MAKRKEQYAKQRLATQARSLVYAHLRAARRRLAWLDAQKP